jgi:hypothetical protein
MPYLLRAERERAEWCTIPEAIGHIRLADRCDEDSARQQLRAALIDGVLTPLRWEDALPEIRWPRGFRPTGSLTVPDDLPPCPDRHWANVKIDWQTGTVQDDWAEVEPCQRVLLMRRDVLSRFWPELLARGVETAAAPPEPQAAGAAPGESKQNAGRKQTMAAAARDFIAASYPNGLPAGQSDKLIAAEYTRNTGLLMTERSVRRARTGK